MNFIPNTENIEQLSAEYIAERGMDKESKKKIDELKVLLRNNPNNVNTLLRLALCYFEAHNDGEAIRIYKALLEKDPNNVDACIWFAELLIWGWANAEKAQIILNHALQIDPQRADIHHLFACAYNKMDDIIQEKYHLRKSIELEPHWLIDRTSLIDLLIKNKEFKAAQEEIKKALPVIAINEQFPVPTNEMEVYYESLITGRIKSTLYKTMLEQYQKTIDENIISP